MLNNYLQQRQFGVNVTQLTTIFGNISVCCEQLEPIHIKYQIENTTTSFKNLKKLTTATFQKAYCKMKTRKIIL